MKGFQEYEFIARTGRKFFCMVDTKHLRREVTSIMTKEDAIQARPVDATAPTHERI